MKTQYTLAKKFLLLLIIIVFPIKFAFGEDNITGIWIVPPDPRGDFPIAKLFEKDDKFYAVFFSFSSDNKMFKDLEALKKMERPRDIQNPDESLRDRYLQDIVAVTAVEREGNKLKNGRIYNAETGKSYYLKGKILDGGNKIVWRASIDKAGAFGKTFKWDREKPAKIYELVEHSPEELENLVDEMIKNQETKKISSMTNA